MLSQAAKNSPSCPNIYPHESAARRYYLLSFPFLNYKVYPMLKEIIKKAPENYHGCYLDTSGSSHSVRIT